MLRTCRFIFVAVSGVLAFNTVTYSMEALNDTQLQGQTGQAGITLAVSPAASGVVGLIGVNTIQYNQGNAASMGSAGVANFLQANSANRSAGLSFNFANGGIRFCTDQGLVGCTLSKQSIGIVIDADGNGGKPVLNIKTSLQPDLKRIKLNLNTIAQIGKNGTTTTSSDLIRLVKADGITQSTNGLSLNLDTTAGVPSFTLQLGNNPMGSLAVVNNLNIANIQSDTWLIPSYAGSTASTGIRFTPSIDGLNLSGGRISIIKDQGLQWSQSSMQAQNLSLNDVTMGEIGASSASSFGGTNNAPMGSMGVTGVNVSGLSVTVKGL